MASFSAVIGCSRTGSMPISWSGGIIAQSRQASHRFPVGGTTGRPSVQPLLWNSSCAAAKSATS